MGERALGKAGPDADSTRCLHGLVAAGIDARRLLEVTQADLLHLEGMRQPGGAQANHHGVGRQPQRLLVGDQRFGEAALLVERLRPVAQRGEPVVQGIHGERSSAPRDLAGDYGPRGAPDGACGEDDAGLGAGGAAFFNRSSSALRWYSTARLSMRVRVIRVNGSAAEALVKNPTFE